MCEFFVGCFIAFSGNHRISIYQGPLFRLLNLPAYFFSDLLSAMVNKLVRNVLHLFKIQGFGNKPGIMTFRERTVLRLR